MTKKQEKYEEERAESLALFAQTLEYIKQDIKEIKEKLDNKYVTKEEFSTVRTIAYSLVSVVCLSALGAVMALIFRS